MNWMKLTQKSRCKQHSKENYKMLINKETCGDTLKYEIKKIDYKIAELEEMIEQHSDTLKTQDEINHLKNLREQKKIKLILFE